MFKNATVTVYKITSYIHWKDKYGALTALSIMVVVFTEIWK